MTAKKYPALNMRISKEFKESLDLLAKNFGVENTLGAYPRVIRMAVRSLKDRLISLKEEFGKDFELKLKEDGIETETI